MERRPEPRDWFRVEELAPGVVMLEEPWQAEEVKSYLISGSEAAVLLDTGTGMADMRSLVAELTGLPLTVVQSHSHWDHIGAAADFAVTAPIYIHLDSAAALRQGVSAEQMARYLGPATLRGEFAGLTPPPGLAIRGVEPTGWLADGMVLPLGDRELVVIETPGHTVGHISLWDPARRALFSTDAAYAAPLYAQMDDSNLDDYLVTLTRLAALEPLAVYPAHGPSPIDAGMLPRMRDAMAEVIAGRVAELHREGVAGHDFGEFVILVPGEPA